MLSQQQPSTLTWVACPSSRRLCQSDTLRVINGGAGEKRRKGSISSPQLPTRQTVAVRHLIICIATPSVADRTGLMMLSGNRLAANKINNLHAKMFNWQRTEINVVADCNISALSGAAAVTGWWCTGPFIIYPGRWWGEYFVALSVLSFRLIRQENITVWQIPSTYSN